MSQARTYDARIAAIHTLRVNVKSLAAESRIIRREERRADRVYRQLLASHRREWVRYQARYAQLALAFLRGRPYRQVEHKCQVPVQPKWLYDKCLRFLESVTPQEVAQWLAT